MKKLLFTLACLSLTTACVSHADNLTIIYRDGSRQSVPLAQPSQNIRALELGEGGSSVSLPEGPLAGVRTLKARHSGKCLDVAGIGRNNGDNVHQWECHGGDNQKWRFMLRGGDFHTLVALHSGKCLDVAGAGRRNGDNVQQWECHGGDNQIWRVVPEGDGYYRLIARHSGLCLDVAGIGRNNGDNVHQWECHGGDNQKWRIE